MEREAIASGVRNVYDMIDWSEMIAVGWEAP